VRLLLDTHVWLWQALAPELLSKRAAAALVTSDADLFLSPISVWEALVLAERGRVQLHPDPIQWVRRALSVLAATMAELTHEVAMESRQLRGLDTQDPADRFLAATARTQDLTLVTADRTLRRCRGIRTIW
jgi:PIN domain nuclease of toxin-antitoxin system